MLSTAERAYGVADPGEVRLISGREFLQAMMDGRYGLNVSWNIRHTSRLWASEPGRSVPTCVLVQ